MDAQNKLLQRQTDKWVGKQMDRWRKIWIDTSTDR